MPPSDGCQDEQGDYESAAALAEEAAREVEVAQAAVAQLEADAAAKGFVASGLTGGAVATEGALLPEAARAWDEFFEAVEELMSARSELESAIAYSDYQASAALEAEAKLLHCMSSPLYKPST